jgi:hypothetical protein
MNLQEIKEDLLLFLKNQFEFEEKDLNIRENDDEIEITANMVVKSIDDNIRVSFYVNQKNFAGIAMTFDRLQKTIRAYELINQFNRQNYIFKAYINENGYLEFSHILLSIHHREELKEQLPNLIGLMFNDDNLKLLTPLTELTYEG